MKTLTPNEVYDLIRQGAADGGWQGFAIKVQEALMKKNGYQMKPCPFCGMNIDPNDPDLVYPSGSGWIDEEELGQGFRHYVSAYEVPKEQWCYNVVCQTHYGGCGCTMSGDSKEEAINNWNKRCST